MESTAPDVNEAISGLDGLGSEGPFGSKIKGAWGRPADGEVTETERKKEEKSPWGNLPHCANKPDNTMNLLFPSQLKWKLMFYHTHRLACC